MAVPFAIVHHANQYLITNGYENRHGLRATLGSVESKSGLAWILELHRIHQTPLNLHVSGTLLEAIAWHQPAFLHTLKELCNSGLIEIVGSCYAQNIMRFFGYDHNLKQLNEELQLYQAHLGLDPTLVRVFWPPERVWDTERMAAVLSDPRLLNKGYQYTLVDDRLLLPVGGFHSPRRKYDREQAWDPQLFRMVRIERGQGLVALPIAYHLRQNIPPVEPCQLRCVQDQLQWLSSLEPAAPAGDLIAIYGDDMEKAAGLGSWNRNGPRGFEALLQWINENPWIEPVRLTDWCSARRIAEPWPLEVGTFLELANHFAAGEGYEKWYFDPQWDRYRQYFSWAESRVNELSLCGADAALIELAEKHLLASSWESAWHTPGEGPFGSPEASGHPSPWIKALASHSRHASVIAEAACWMKHKDDAAHAGLCDIDADGEDELVVKNDKLFAVISPRWGGRLVALFLIEGPRGKMLIGNPCDDWNWMEELNRYMEVPPNHPGALTDVGFQHDIYKPGIAISSGSKIEVALQNKQPHSNARDLKKTITLEAGESALRVEYALPETLRLCAVEFGLSPDYLCLLRCGRALLRESQAADGFCASAAGTSVSVRTLQGTPGEWSRPYRDEFGHVSCARFTTPARQFQIAIGVEST